MDLTCLSGGGGFYFPPCHLVDVCGFRVLFDCPLDLSALTIFSPIITDSNTLLGEDVSASSSAKSLDLEYVDENGQKIENCLNANNLIQAEPWYKTVKNLHMWDPSFIDVVLISSPAGMLGLPFLTRNKDFSAKVYATEATARLGQLLMEDLVVIHLEFKQLYGPEESGFPQWMKWEKLEMLPLALKEIVLGKDGTELGGWMPLYSAADLKHCMKKVQALKYAEEACYNGTLIIKAFSSGLDIGTCNWTINGPKTNIAYLSSSVFWSAAAMSFDYHALDRSDLIIYSDCSLCVTGTIENENACSPPDSTKFSTISSCIYDSRRAIAESLLTTDESSEDMEKLDFICSCSINSVKDGGSVLIPIGRLGILLQLLEKIACALQSSNLDAPIFIISSVAEELLAFFDIIPEWLCKQRQERLYSGQPLFVHEELRKEKRLHLFPAVHSLQLLKFWQEPCIVFCPHWSLRLGPVAHLLRRWSGDQNSLLVLEEGVDADLALLPFKPISMKVLQCSFVSGIKLHEVQPLLKILQPKFVLCPTSLRQHIEHQDKSLSFTYYSENETVHIPDVKDSLEIDIATELASQFHWMNLKQKDASVARLSGDLVVEQGRHRLLPGNKQVVSTPSRPLLLWGMPNLQCLLTALQKMGMNASVEQCMNDGDSENAYVVHVFEPSKASIEVKAACTVITTADDHLASLISEAICSIVSGV